MIADDFKVLLNGTTDMEAIVRDHLFEGEPVAFAAAPEAYTTLRQHLVRALGSGVTEDSIRVVGSARMGYSLKPSRFPRPLHPASDIDVVVVSSRLFDQVWDAILHWYYPRRTQLLPDKDFQWFRKRQKELFWGWFVPSEIRYDGLQFPATLKPLRNLTTRWFNAFQSLSVHPELSARSVSGRLYRNWNHATLYHAYGLREIKERLAGGANPREPIE